jgi:hypothetical protein
VAADTQEGILKEIFSLVGLSPLQEEFPALHKRLWYLPLSVMF